MAPRVRLAAALVPSFSILSLVGCPRGQQAQAPPAGSGQAPQPRGIAEIERLQVDVDLLDQINRLNLTQEQARNLIEAANQIRTRAAAPLTGDAKGKADALRQLLARQQELLLRDDQEVPADLQDQMGKATEAFDQAMEADAQAQVKEGAAVLREALSPEQVQVAIGGDLAQQRALQMLDHFRRISQADFDASAGNEAEVQGAEGGDPAVTPQVLLGVWRQARTMSEQAYEEAKDDLAAKTVGAYGPTAEEADQMLVSWAMEETLVRLLQEKLNYLPADTAGAGSTEAPQG